jgi:hypothetical protein
MASGRGLQTSEAKVRRMTWAVTPPYYLCLVEGHICQRDREALCFECYRSRRERQRAGARAAAKLPMLRSPFGVVRTLSTREIHHRQLMLDNCARQGASAQS